MKEHLTCATDLAPVRKIWIDLDNSPHVPFFAPIIEELRKSGFSLLITARDCFQVCELADLHGIPYVAIGRHYGKALPLKLYGLCARAKQLAPIVLRESPILAVSHGSRSQLLLSQLLGIPSVRIFDYEYARNPPFMKATWGLAPEVIPVDTAEKKRGRTLTYPGIKEDVYVPRFMPDRELRRDLRVRESDIMVTVRPPATEAHYRSPKSEILYHAAMELLLRSVNVRIVMVPRA
jgi:predicted glycosyltransferase